MESSFPCASVLCICPMAHILENIHHQVSILLSALRIICFSLSHQPLAILQVPAAHGGQQHNAATGRRPLQSWPRMIIKISIEKSLFFLLLDL